MLWIILFVIVGGIIIAVIAQVSVNNAAIEQQGKALASLPDFSSDVSFKAGSLGPGTAIDATRSKFAIVPQSGPARIFSFNQLTAIDIEKNGSSIQTTNRGSQAFGAAVGGVLLGPVGLLLGGLSGSKKSVEKIKRLSLKIYTNDLVKPMHEIVFFDHPSGVNPDSILVKPAIDNMEQWYGRFRTILAAPKIPDSGELIPEIEADQFKLTLLADGGNKIGAIKVIMEITGLGLTDAKQFSDTLPAMIAGPMSHVAASVLEEKFRDVGASTRIEPI